MSNAVNSNQLQNKQKEVVIHANDVTLVRSKDSVDAKSLHLFKKKLEKFMEKKSFRVTKPTSDSVPNLNIIRV